MNRFRPDGNYNDYCYICNSLLQREGREHHFQVFHWIEYEGICTRNKLIDPLAYQRMLTHKAFLQAEYEKCKVHRTKGYNKNRIWYKFNTEIDLEDD